METQVVGCEEEPARVRKTQNRTNVLKIIADNKEVCYTLIVDCD